MAITNDAALDAPDADNSDVVSFPATAEATVTAGQTISNVFIPGT